MIKQKTTSDKLLFPHSSCKLRLPYAPAVAVVGKGPPQTSVTFCRLSLNAGIDHRNPYYKCLRRLPNPIWMALAFDQ